MNTIRSSSKSIPTLLAAALVVVLAGSLGARLIARGGRAVAPTAAAAVVPAPLLESISDLEVPCWSCREAKEWPVDFRSDLDLLAPLGNGVANAGVFFVDFRKPDGPRLAEATVAMKDRVDGPEWLGGKIMPFDHPLLREAEPWCDQATMTFYPDLLALEGYTTAIPNLLYPLNLARTWVARGMVAEDMDSAMDDFRRAIRLGRLLRQEDVVIISDLVGLACIRYGAEGIYRRALADGDLDLALLASVVLGEVAPQRLRTSENITATDLAGSFRSDGQGGWVLAMPGGRLDPIIEKATNAPERRFRCEAMLSLNFVRFLGTTEEQAAAYEVLDQLVTSDDPIISETATWGRDTPPVSEAIEEWAGVP